MSLQLATAPGALVSLGVGVGDVAAIISYGKRIGNWWTAPSGDIELLTKRWRKRIDLLANGRPLRLEEEEIKKVLGDVKDLIQDLPVFTSVMTCLVAVLDQFASDHVVRNVVHNVLKTFLKPNENGEEILRSQYKSRLNAWRSIACLRGFTQAAGKHQSKLVKRRSILAGRMPEQESVHMERFLVWLLGTNDPCFKTSSSDVAGVAACLECAILYSAEPFFHPSTVAYKANYASIDRFEVVHVPLQHPWETINVFPISMETQNQCRSAWKSGELAAKAVSIGIRAEGLHGTYFSHWQPALTYSILDRGHQVERVSAELNTIAQNYALVMNREILDGL
ncbi:hypothetical protein F5Y16DRAFT_400659 [Xylariaceae sp. FL0255]|nr:hypothetical protein F5Y16DRAFT_400659 [Xylariaceae sp. FL0255]